MPGMHKCDSEHEAREKLNEMLREAEKIRSDNQKEAIKHKRERNRKPDDEPCAKRTRS